MPTIDELIDSAEEGVVQAKKISGDDLLSAAEDERRESLSVSINSAVKKNPEQSAKIYNLAKEKGLPTDYVERNQEKVLAPNIDSIGPNVAELLRNRDYAAMSHDDTDNLSWWEKAAKEGGNFAKTTANEAGNLARLTAATAHKITAAGYSILGQGLTDVAALTLYPAIKLYEGTKYEKYLPKADPWGPLGAKMTEIGQGQMRRSEELMPKDSVINPAVWGGIDSAINSVANIGVSIAAKKPQMALRLMGGEAEGTSYLNAKSAGLDERSSQLYAAAQAQQEIVTELIPVGRLFKDLADNSTLKKTVTNQLVLDGLGEQASTLWGDAIDWAMLNPDKTLKEFAEERKDAAVNTFIAALVGAGVSTSIIHTVNAMGSDKANIQALADKANESKVNKRSAEVFGRFVQDLAEEHGAADNVYLDAKVARKLFQSMEQDAAYDVIAAQIDSAEAVNGDIVIPVGDFVTKIAPSNNFDLIKDSLRLSPELPSSADQITDDMKASISQVSNRTKADEIAKEYTQKLIDTGRMSKSEAKANQMLYTQYLATQADKMGVPIEELHSMLALDVQGSDASNGKALNQKEIVGDLPKFGLSVANIGSDGKIYVGEKGQSHFHLSDKYGKEIRDKQNLKDGDETWESIGFINSNGKFLTREEALKSVLDSDPEFKPSLNMKDELDAIDYAERNKKQYPLESIDKWYGDSDYASRGGELVYMSPSKYLASVKELKKSDLTDENVSDLINHIKSGGKLDPLAIYKDGSEDGRHRALAAKELGISLVPVIDFRGSKLYQDNIPWHTRKVIGGDFLMAGWTLLAMHDDAFQLPISKETDFVKLNEDLNGDKGFTAEQDNSLAAQKGIKGGKSWRINIPASSKENDAYSQELADFESGKISDKPYKPKGSKATLYQKGKSVWIDISDSVSGEDGKRVYNAVGNYAFNNDLVFKGDPEGLSITAMSRRLENMASLALKFGTTKHLWPHDFQIDGRGEELGIPAIKWKDGDDANNIKELIKASYESTKNQFPEIENLTYNPESGKFEDKTGKEVTRDEITKLAGKRRASESELSQSERSDELAIREGIKGKITAGSTSIERAIFTHSLLRGTSDQKSRILESISEQLPERLSGLLYQEHRGAYEPLINKITLTPSSNRSTWFHELGHAFFEMQRRLIEHPKATERMKEDGRLMLEFLGVKSFDDLKDYETNPVSREAHEKWAKAFEKYIAEGKAPSIELKPVFRRFAAWMKQVYRNLTGLNVELSDDIRGVMDRMLATDEQIDRVRGIFNPLFKSAEEAGMTESEFNAYMIESSPDSAKEVLLAKMMKQLERQYTKWWNDESAVIAAQVKKDVVKQPVYAAISSMKSDVDKLNRKAVEDHFKGNAPSKFDAITSEGGANPDEIAAAHGFESGSDLIDQIAVAPPMSQVIKNITNAQMIDRHGDILNDGTIAEEAAQAIRNPEHQKKLLAELGALARKIKAPAIDREAIKAFAKEAIGKTPYSKIRPDLYRSAEIRSAREAAIAKERGDFYAAHKAKQQEIINFHLAKEAALAKERGESDRKYLQSIPLKEFKNVHPDYVTQMQALASIYDFRKNAGDQDRLRSRLQSIASWIQAQEKSDDGDHPIMIDGILSQIYEASINNEIKTMVIPSYKEMTADQISDVAEQVRNLRYIGGLLSDASKEKLKKEYDAVAASIRENAGKIIDVPEEVKARDQKLSALREFGQDHIRLANQIEEMDGFKEFGPLFNSFYQDIIDSTNKELKLKRVAFDDLKEALSGLKANEMAEGKDEKTVSYVEKVGDLEVPRKLTLSRRGRIMFGLYWGSPEGRKAILQGHGMDEAAAQQMLDLLDDKDIKAIEGIWAANERHWPEISRINQKLKGATLPKVEHVPYYVNGRKLPGGYIRLSYQYASKDSINGQKAEDLLMTRTGNRLVKSTKAGHRNERVGAGNKKLSWEFNNVFKFLDETIHDVAFAETAAKTGKLISSSEVRSAIVDSYGKEKYESLLGAWSGVIAGNTAIRHPITGFLQHFRVAQTYGMLGYSIRNLVQQPIAYTNVMGKAVTSFDGFGEAKVIHAIGQFLASPKETIAFVDAKSDFMVNRTSVVNRDTSDIKQRLSHGTMAGGAWAAFKEHAFDLQTMGDSAVAYPSWMAAYNEGLKKFGNEKKAVTFADEFVSATIGSGLIKDLSPMLQGGGKVGQAIGSEQLKALTFMGSFFNVNFNLMRDSFKKSNYIEVAGIKTVPTKASFYRQMAWYLAVPAMLSAWMVGDGADDDENFFSWAFEQVAAYGLSAVFVVRDLVTLAKGFGPSSSYTRALVATGKLAKESVKIAEGEKDVDTETAAKLLRSAGMVVPIPASGQAARTLEALGSDANYNPYQVLVTGVER